MKRILIVLGFSLIAAGYPAVLAHAQSGASEQDAVRTAHAKFMDAFKSCNAKGLEDVLADDARMIHTNGRLDDKKGFIKGVAGCGIVDIQPKIESVRVFGTTGIVVGHRHVKTKGGGLDVIFTEVLVKEPSGWRVTSSQATVVPPAVSSSGAATPSR